MYGLTNLASSVFGIGVEGCETWLKDKWKVERSS